MDGVRAVSSAHCERRIMSEGSANKSLADQNQMRIACSEILALFQIANAIQQNVVDGEMEMH